jgi:transposase-like protein/transposase Tn5 family protein
MPWTAALGAVDWAAEQFGSVQLGDRRLNRRVVQVAAAMAANPAGSIPRQNRDWDKTKGAYRLFDHQRATFESVSEPCWRRTRTQCGTVAVGAAVAGVVLLLQDTTWVDYATHPHTQGLGWHGRCAQHPRGGRGLFLHSVLAVEPTVGAAADGSSSSGRVIGLAWGKLWVRDGEPINHDPQRRNRRRRSDDRESLRWSEAVKQVGSPPPPPSSPAVDPASSSPSPSPSPTRWIHVGDRESDMFSLYEQTRAMNGVGFVVRVFRERNASVGHDTPETMTREQRQSSNLKDICRAMPALGGRQLWIAPKAGKPGQTGKAGRWANLSVSGGAVTLWSPQLNRTGRALRCWVVRVWEANPPQGCEAVEWILLTSEPVEHLEDALRIAGYYALRWLIEQYHQCLKSGCKVEERQLETADRLKPLIGMLCAVAVRLLQLKNDARLTPDLPAQQRVPVAMVQTLSKLIEVDADTLTVRRFTHEVAKLGGFLGRKGDGDPGWRTLWQGWRELSLIHAGYELARAEKVMGNG